MYKDKDNKRETAANIIAIAIIFAVIQIIGMIVCMIVKFKRKESYIFSDKYR